MAINRNIYNNNFLDVNSNKNGLLFTNRYDEPTYLTIRVDFFPEYLTEKNDPELTDFHGFVENTKLTMTYNDMPNPLFDANGDYSTYKYLRDNLGDVTRAKLLKNLIKGFADLTWKCPYYIKSIEGLDEILNVDPKRGSRIKSDAVITLKFEEGLDQRITMLKNLYKKIAWDDVYQRWILPDMMRFFKMNIYISEFRIFHTPNITKIKNDVKKSENKLLEYAQDAIEKNIKKFDSTVFNYFKYIDNINLNRNIPTMCLSCRMCEFDISDTFSHLSELSTYNISDPLTDLEMKIKVGNIIEHSKYNLFGYDDLNMIGNIFINDTDFVDVSNGKSNYVTYNNDISDESLRIIKDGGVAINYRNRTGIDIEKYNETDVLKDLRDNAKLNMYQSVLKSAAEYNKYEQDGKGSSYIGRVIKNSSKNALAWVRNKVKDEVFKLMNKDIIKGWSLNDLKSALKSENIFAMYNIFKTNAESIKTQYPEISKATNGNIDLDIFKDILKNIASSEATDDNDVVMKNISQNLLDYGDEIGAESIDDYMNALRSIIDRIEYSSATSTKIENNIDIEMPQISAATNKKIAL